MTQTNGETFYLVDTVLGTTDTYELTGATYGRELRTQFLDPIPAGRLVTHLNGRMFVAEDNVVWFEEAFTSGLTKLSSNFFMYPKPVTMLNAVDGGLYVAADKLYFLKGTNPATMEQEDFPYDAVFGTAIYVPGDKFQDGAASKPMLMWVSSQGIITGTNEGQVLNLTENIVSYPVGDEGAGLFRQKEGVAQYVSTLKEPKDGTEAFGVSDRVTAAVYRDGVLIT